MAGTFLLEIITPERTFFQGQVEEVVLTSLDGVRGILPGHVPMVAGLGIGEVRVLQDGKWREAACSEGFVRIGPDHTLIMAQTMEWPEEIDMIRAEEKIRLAREALRQKASMREYVHNKTTLAKALMRLQVGGRRTINN